MRNRYFARSAPGSPDQPFSKRLASRTYGESYVLGPGLRDLCERLLRRRADRRVALAGTRLDQLAADEQSVALGDGDDVARLRRRGVVPRRRNRRGTLFLLELSQR